jgi:replicative DNA helicase
VLADHFGGGLWPGLHVINSGTAVGKTQFAIGQALFSAKASIPVLYVGLELGQFEIDLRVLGLESEVPWSHLWVGKADEEALSRVERAAAVLRDLPFHYEVARPMGFSAADIGKVIEAMRKQYPDGPLLVVVDFLQLVGDDPDDERDLRIRIARASYALRDAANRLGAAVICISSVARERYKLLSDIRNAAQLTFAVDPDGCPISRRILDPDAIVGAGKESGEIEYSADSVSVIARVPDTWDDTGCHVIFATAKGRATGATWSPLRFTRFAYTECADQGAAVIAAWNAAEEGRAQASEAKKQAKEDAKGAKIDADAKAVARYVLQHSGCTVREARTNAVNDSSRRWTPAVARLGDAFLQAKSGKRDVCCIDAAKLKPEHRA